MKLRSYQVESIDAVEQAWQSGVTRAAVDLPTGVGKTVIFSEMTRRLRERGRRVLILVHREELVTQTVQKLRSLGVHDVGVVKGPRNEVGAGTVVATVQTLYHDRRVEQITADVVICDEMHHFVSNQNRKLLDRLGCYNGRTKAAGFTATFSRSDSQRLANDWHVVYSRDVQWAIEHGYLTDVDAKVITVPDLDLQKVRSSSGDFEGNSLGKAMQASSAGEVIVSAWRKYADGLPTILFAPTVAACQQFTLEMLANGIAAESVFGTTKTAEREAIYDRVRGGQTKVLSSVGVLTEGFDIPAIACAILARPTKSKGLWQQMAGRALRLHPKKDKAILLDITGSALDHSLASITDLTKSNTDEETTKSAPSLCFCDEAGDLCCTPDLLKAKCRVNKDAGTCRCNCFCDDVAERDELKLVRGDHDIELDLFAGSTSAWLQTYRGVWFIPTRDRVFFIGQRDEGYHVFYSGDPYTLAGGGVHAGPLDESSAMMIAQDLAENTDSTVASRTAAWRKTRPSAGQLNFARSLGIETEGMRKGPVSDAISVHLASQVIDPWIGIGIRP